MAYASWSVVFGEQPSAAKWNILGTNDSSFNDGTGLTAINYATLTTISNPYKFHVYKNGAQNTGNGAYAKITFDTEVFDTNNNFDSSTNNRYVAPVNGFYNFYAAGNYANAARDYILAIYKNGVITQNLQEITGNASFNVALSGAVTLQAVATDYFEIFAYANTTTGMNSGAANIYFGGHLVSRT